MDEFARVQHAPVGGAVEALTCDEHHLRSADLMMGDPRVPGEVRRAPGDVQGDTDSERYAALIAKFADEHGDVGEGMIAAANWLADTVPMYSLPVNASTAPPTGACWILANSST